MFHIQRQCPVILHSGVFTHAPSHLHWYAGEYFSDSYSSKDLSAEVDRALYQRYGQLPEVQKAIEFLYTNWSLPHGPTMTEGQEAMREYYNRAEVWTIHMNIAWWDRTRSAHDDVIKWKHFPRYWPFVQGIHRFTPHRGQWRGALMFSLICAWINTWANNGEAGHLRRHRAHYDVNIMFGPVLEVSGRCWLSSEEITMWCVLLLAGTMHRKRASKRKKNLAL